MKRAPRFLFTLSIPLVITFFAYTASILLSESEAYTQSSIRYFILTPAEIRDMTALCETPAAFQYSSADGPKPAITTLICKMSAKRVFDRLAKHRFERTGHNAYARDNAEIQVSPKNRDIIEKVALLEYL